MPIADNALSQLRRWNGERDRPGRTRRRPADGFAAMPSAKNKNPTLRQEVFGGTPKTAGGTPALPRPNVSFRLKNISHFATTSFPNYHHERHSAIR